MPILGIPTSYADLTHNGLVKGAAGGIIEGYGAVTGNQTATNLGHNLTNPNVNIYGQLNPAVTGANWNNVPTINTSAGGLSPVAQPSANAGQTTAGSSGGVSSGPSAADLAAYSVYSGQANKALSDLLGAYNTANKSENSAYGQKSNELEIEGENHRRQNIICSPKDLCLAISSNLVPTLLTRIFSSILSSACRAILIGRRGEYPA